MLKTLLLNMLNLTQYQVTAAAGSQVTGCCFRALVADWQLSLVLRCQHLLSSFLHNNIIGYYIHVIFPCTRHTFIKDTIVLLYWMLFQQHWSAVCYTWTIWSKWLCDLIWDGDAWIYLIFCLLNNVVISEIPSVYIEQKFKHFCSNFSQV